MIPLFILISLQLIRMGIELAMNGKPSGYEYNAVRYFVSSLIIFALYYWAGLFDVLLK